MATPLMLDTARGSDGKLMLVAVGEIDLSNVDAFTLALSSAAITALATHADRIELVAHPILMPVLKLSGLTELTAIVSAPPSAEQ